MTRAIGEWPLTDWRPFASLFVCLFFYFKQKMKEKLGNRGFGLSTDEFLKSVKQFLVKKVRTIPSNSRSRPPQHTSLLFWFIFTMLSPDRLIFLESMASHFFASAREAYKSLACRNLSKFMYNYVVIVMAGYWASWLLDTRQHRSSAKILISRWKRRQTVFLHIKD